MLSTAETHSTAQDTLPPSQFVHELAPYSPSPVEASLDPAEQDHSDIQPSQEEIALVAYNLYAARGYQDGADVEDWLTAEDMLRRRYQLRM